MPVERSQYLMTLELAPRLLDDAVWTEEERQRVAEHYQQLLRLAERGTVLMAGRTLAEQKRMAIVVLDGVTEDEARRILAEDAAVAAGIMSGDVFPFRVVLGGPPPPGSSAA